MIPSIPRHWPAEKYGRGRPPGSRNKIAGALQETLEEHAESLTKKCLYLALQGNPTAMRLCMERLMPARRQRVLQFKLPALKTMADMAAASETVVRGVARGRLTPGEGQAFTLMLDGRRRVIETEELEGRIRALEPPAQTKSRAVTIPVFTAVSTAESTISARNGSIRSSASAGRPNRG